MIAKNRIIEIQKDDWETRIETFTDFLNERLIVSTSSYVYLIDFNKILFLKAESNYTKIVLANYESILSSKTLKIFEKALIKKGFLRVHSSYIVNLTKVTGIKRNGIHTMILENDIKIPVSRSYKEILLSNIF